jgi:hypothetical protein
LGASPELFARILGGHVYLAALIGGNALSALPGRGLTIFLICTAVAGTALVGICAIKAPLEMKLFILFSAVLFASALIAPVEWGRPDLPIWNVLSGSVGYRHWFFPTLAFAWSLPWGLKSRAVPIKFVSATLLCIMCLGIIRDWRHPTFQETHFAESVRLFDNAPAGSVVTIEEQPQGWNMKLVKHPTKQ